MRGAFLVLLLMAGCEAQDTVSLREFMDRVCTGTCERMQACGDLSQSVDQCASECLIAFCPQGNECSEVFPAEQEDDVNFCYYSLEIDEVCPARLPDACKGVLQ